MDMEQIASDIINGSSTVGTYDVYALLFAHHLTHLGDTTFMWKYQRLINAIRMINPNCRIIIIIICSLLPFPDSPALRRQALRKNWVLKHQFVPANSGLVYSDVLSKMSGFGRELPARYFDESDRVLNSTRGWPKFVQVMGHKIAGMLDLEWAHI